MLGASLLATGVALAGSSSNQQVVVGTTGGLLYAKGTFRPVRNSADSTQYIGCSIYAYDSGSRSIACYATDAVGNYRNCSTSDPGMVQVAASLNPASYLYFVVNADGSCNRVISVNASYNL